MRDKRKKKFGGIFLNLKRSKTQSCNVEKIVSDVSNRVTASDNMQTIQTAVLHVKVTRERGVILHTVYHSYTCMMIIHHECHFIMKTVAVHVQTGAAS